MYKYLSTLIVIVLFAACSESKQEMPAEIPFLEVEKNSLEADYNSSTLSFSISTDDSWTLSGFPLWCIPDKKEGIGNSTVSLRFTDNIRASIRKASLMLLSNKGLRQTIQIAQRGFSGEYHYELPVVFHILYSDPNDPNQYVDGAWLKELITICNGYYKKNLDMNLEFTLATEDYNGNQLSEPGINRVRWDTPKMNHTNFMSDFNDTHAALIWDPNQYINIVLFTFENKNTAGISHLPYTVSANPLAGLHSGDFLIGLKQIPYPHCVAINNSYIYSISENDNEMEEDDIRITLAHELGHYLGLDHVFSEYSCNGNDYCNDTPNYNRKEYTFGLSMLDWSQLIPFSELAQRVACDGTEFTSTNIMDYGYSYYSEFTPDQRKRIRHVLNYSPLIPGPKLNWENLQSKSGLTMPPVRFIE